jgi:uncharacterized phage protein (TIGR02216 family)
LNDWPSLLRLAAMRFHIPPEAVWRLSVKEWTALTAPPPSSALGRGDFADLMKLHPDRHPRDA